MRRTITDQLIDWKTSSRRPPLLLRGARQVGKTWAVTDFVERHMPGRLHLVDFERDVEWRRFFEGNLDIDRILGALELAVGRSIAVGQDLLFLDEIQACPRAVVALRYFYEQLPQLHVVAAGSLIEFALGSISFPVGRVQMLPLHPLSFLEFLWARGNEPAADVVRAVPRDLGRSMHEALLENVRDYMFVGGMPAAVAVFVETGRISEARRVQDGRPATPRISRPGRRRDRPFGPPRGPAVVQPSETCSTLSKRPGLLRPPAGVSWLCCTHRRS